MADQNDIIITKTDKGGVAIIIDFEDYVKEAEHQLNKKYSYEKLQHDPTQTHTRLVNDTITRFKNDKFITENIVKFYTQSKIHKKGKSGRLVVSSINYHTNTI